MSPAYRAIHTIGSLRKDAGGTTEVVAKLCGALGRLGQPTDLLSQERVGVIDSVNLIPTSEMVSTLLVPARRIPLLGSTYSTSFRRQLRDRLGRSPPAIIHNHGLWLPINHQSAVVARNLRIPIICSPHGMLEPWAWRHHAWKKRLAWWLYQRTDLRSATVLHATAEQEASNLREMGLRQPIAVIPNGIDLPSRMDRVRDDDARRVALFLSRIHPKKGLVELVEAWRIVRPDGWRMVVAGPDEGGHRAVVEERIRAAGLQEVFELVGPVEEPARTELYRSADLFILPTFSENFGLVVAEALSQGVPVITTKGAPWGDLERYDCGWWIAAGVEPLRAALREATSRDDEALRAMGERGRVYAQRYDWADIARRIGEVYRWMLGHEARPDCVHD